VRWGDKRGRGCTVIWVDQVVVVEVDGGDVLVVAAAGGHGGVMGTPEKVSLWIVETQAVYWELTGLWRW
jgi:hypothetical protein